MPLPPSLDHFNEGQQDFFARLGELSTSPPEELLTWLTGYFASKAAGREFKRKPSMRFRTTFEERQVDVLPAWQSSGARQTRKVLLIPGQLYFNLNAFSERFKAYHWVLMLRWQPAKGFTYRAIAGGYGRGLEELERLHRFFEAATLDREASLRAGAAGRCCFCGKVLTDPVSMARGIGPECYRDFIGFSGVQPTFEIPQEGEVK